ncbi:hypothetical protein PGT21_034504 [Puccinia graminis f. sp. tritici]|uniref:DUF7872 domain-containing protein n=1 Tax=Puccinia graminis f. sp. tritici TaxID=56615 RepID=A0A5B0MWH0_PUCGR|nr:hypothetical protein PGT21_034504 [Puccinia graminis f. sp. tritici]KAA1092011.1 hypothetical protein PGTUg99_013256 [Puccinia graminis f. sp. tritici]
MKMGIASFYPTLSLIVLSTLFRTSNGLVPSNCDRPPAVHSAWHANHMDDYLQNYPQAGSLTFQEYLNQVGVHDFSCGIGKDCELTRRDSCNQSINDSDWLILESVANWNTYVNSLSTETDRIGTELFTDVAAKMAGFLDQPDQPPRAHLRKRGVGHDVNKIEKIPNDIKVAEAERPTGDFEVDPVEIKNGLKAPLVTRVVPESKNLVPLQLPSMWLRVTRYLKEFARRGSLGIRKMMRSNKSGLPPVPFFPSELRVVADGADDQEALARDAQKLELLKTWRSAYSKLMNNQVPLDEKVKGELLQELSKYLAEWNKLSQEEFKWVNEQIKKESQADLAKYQQAVRQRADLEGERDGLTASDATDIKVKNQALGEVKKAGKYLDKAQDEVEKARQKRVETLNKLIEDQDRIIESLMTPKGTWALDPSHVESTPELPHSLAGVKIYPPPSPARLEPKELFSKRSAHLAYEKNLLRKRWSQLYQAAIRRKVGETAQRSKARLEELVEIIEQWKLLDREHLLTRRIEAMQALIDHNTQQVPKKKILEVYRSLHSVWMPHVAQLADLKEKHPKEVAEVSALFPNRFIQLATHDASVELKQRMQQKALKKSKTKRDLSSVPSQKKLIEGHEKSAVLSKTKSLVRKNVEKILTTTSLDGRRNHHSSHQGIFKIIQHGRFLSGLDFELLVQDLELLIQLSLVSRMLQKANAYVDVDVSAKCDPQSYQFRINDHSASFCGSQEFVHTITVEEHDLIEPNSPNLNLRDLNNALSSNGYQLSTIIHLALQCHHSKAGAINDEIDVYPMPSSKSLVRLTGVSMCMVELPVHYQATK